MTIQIQTYTAVPSELNCRLRVTVLLKPPVSVDALDELSAVVRKLFRLADVGTYVSEGSRPGDAFFRVVNEQRLATGIVWECDAKAVDHRFAQVLRNNMVMFNQLHHLVERIEMQAIITPPSTGAPLPDLGSRSLADTYPPRSKQLSFRINYEQPEDFRGGRRVEIVFAHPLSDKALEKTLDWLELWADVSLGVYAENEEDVETGECAIFDAVPDIADDYTIEMPIEMFGAVEEAWHSLFNLCERISTDIAPISTVAVE
jgi:hypothetical protein